MKVGEQVTITDTSGILLVNEESIPSELKQLNQWVVWKAELDEGSKKYTKVLYQTNGITRASSIDEKTWDTFKNALDAYENGAGEGVGFVLTESDPYACIDIDGLEDINYLPELAEKIVHLSYSEISPSGKGIHVWVKFQHDNEKYKNKNTQLGYEIYSNKRFITFTGEAINDLPVNEGEEIKAFIEKVFKREVRASTVLSSQQGETGKAALTEDKIIKIAEKSKSGERFKSFMYGGWENKYQSASDADMAFCNDLAFWTNCDYSMMDSIYRKSSIYADRKGSTDLMKWDRQQNSTTYGDETLHKAISDCTNTFDPELQQKEEGNNWWRTNGNGTVSFAHQTLAKEVTKKYSIVRFPSPHSDLYYYNPKKGIYEQDKSGRQINGIIRSFDEELKNSQIREVYHYIQDMSPVINKVNEEFIALENGLLNFKTFQLDKFTPDVFVLQKIPVKYNPNAFDIFVDSTLKKVTQGHLPSILNIQEMFACVLYPGILVPKIHYLYGKSASNGKSSVLNMIHKTFNREGSNISAVTPQKLAVNTFAGSSVYGKLANIVDDNPDSLIEDSGLLKTIVTGGFIEIERKGKDAETVKVNTCMIIASNHLPNFNESGNSINRRLHIIPFEHNFSLDKECLSDVETQKFIESEYAREYVLKLAVDALKRMLENSNPDKLTRNEKSEELASAFAEQNDPLADYFHEFDKDYFEENQGTRVIQDYEQWCKENRVAMLDSRKFKEVVCGRLEMEWKTKKATINGVSKSVKGFKKKVTTFKLG